MQHDQWIRHLSLDIEIKLYSHVNGRPWILERQKKSQGHMEMDTVQAHRFGYIYLGGGLKAWPWTR